MSNVITSVHRAFRVMGSESSLVIDGADDALADRLVARLRELESWWSRFLPDSDITRANRAAGTPVVVHDDTLAVVARAVEAWRQTDGAFDVTVLPALLRAGYTRSWVDGAAAPTVPGRRIGTTALIRLDLDTRTLTVPAGSAIDLGGIGKGFAADLAAEEAMEAGAAGVAVNIGGDLAVLGVPADDVSWPCFIEDPLDPPHHLASLRLEHGGMATSGTVVKHWSAADGATLHHLIDPRTGAPAATQALTASVLAADAATAEAFATACMLLTPAAAVGLLERNGLAGLVVAVDGVVSRTTTLEDFDS